jgi:hypothetical protein
LLARIVNSSFFTIFVLLINIPAMKIRYLPYIGPGIFFIALLVSNPLQAQAFKRGSFVVSLTEGSTQAAYATSDMNDSRTPEFPGHRSSETGCRDPLIIEYGINNRWGIGSTWGNDLYKVNSNIHYGFTLPANASVKTSEYTIDGSFHFLVTRRLDLSLVGSVGTFSVAMNGTSGDYSYSYTSNGNLVRIGVRTRYYFWRRFGVTGMGTVFACNSSPKDVKGNTVGKSTSTALTGSAVEFGLCYRIFR